MESLLARARGITVTDDVGARQDAAKLETDRLTRERRAILKWVFLADLGILVVAWLLLIWSDRVFFTTDPAITRTQLYVPIHFIAAVGLILIALVTFFGLYLASVVGGADFGHSMRNAITAAFVVLYLVMLPFMLLSPQYFSSMFISSLDPSFTGTLNADQLEAVTESVEFGRSIFSGFTNFITIVLGFYFAAQVTEQVSRNREAGETERKEIESLTSIEMMQMQQSGSPQQPDPGQSANQ